MSAAAAPAPPAASGSRRPSLLALTEAYRLQVEALQTFAASASQNDLLDETQKADIDKLSRRFASLLDFKKIDSYDKHDESMVRRLASHLHERAAQLTAIKADTATSLLLAFEHLAWQGVIPALLDAEAACAQTSTANRIRKQITSWESAATEAAYGVCDTYDKRTGAGEQEDKAMRTHSDHFYELQDMYCDVLCRLTDHLGDEAVLGCLMVLDKASKRSLSRARRTMTPEVLGRILFALKTPSQISDWAQVIGRLVPSSSDTVENRQQYAERFFSSMQPRPEGMVPAFVTEFLETAEGGWIEFVSDILADLGQVDPARPNRFCFSRLIPVGRHSHMRLPRIRVGNRGRPNDTAPYDAWLGADGLLINIETGTQAEPRVSTLGVSLQKLKSVTSFGGSKPSLLIETKEPVLEADMALNPAVTGLRIFLPHLELDAAISAFEHRGFTVLSAQGQQGSQSLPKDALDAAQMPPPQGSSMKSSSGKRKAAGVRIQQLPEGVAAEVAAQPGPFIEAAGQKAPKASISPSIDSHKAYEAEDDGDGRISSAETGLKAPVLGRQTTESISENEVEVSESEKVKPVARRVREVGESLRITSTSEVEESSKSKESVWDESSIDPGARGRALSKPSQASNGRRPAPPGEEDEAQRPEPPSDDRESSQPPAASGGRDESAVEVSAALREGVQLPPGSGAGEGSGGRAGSEERPEVRAEKRPEERPPTDVGNIGESEREVDKALPQLGAMIGATQGAAASDEQASRPVEPLTAPPAETPRSAAARSATTSSKEQAPQPQEAPMEEDVVPAQEEGQAGPAVPAQEKEQAGLAVPAQAKAKTKTSPAAPAQAKAALAASRSATSESDLSSADDAVAAAAEAPTQRGRAARASRAKPVAAKAVEQAAADGLSAPPVARSRTRKSRSPEQAPEMHEEAPEVQEEAPVASIEVEARPKRAVKTPYKSSAKLAKEQEAAIAAIAAKQAKSGLGKELPAAIAPRPEPEAEDTEAETSADESEESAPAAPAPAQRPRPRPRSSAAAPAQPKKRKADARPTEEKAPRKRAKATVARAATASPEPESDEEDVAAAYGFGSDAEPPPGGPAKKTGRKSAGTKAKKAAPKKASPKKATPKKAAPRSAAKKADKTTTVEKPAKPAGKPAKSVEKPAKSVEKPPAAAAVSAGRKKKTRASSPPAREEQQAALDEEQDFSDGPPPIDSGPASNAGNVDAEMAPEERERDRRVAARPGRTSARDEPSEAEAERPRDEAAAAAPLGVNNGDLLSVPRKPIARSSSGSEKASRAPWMSKPNAAASAKRVAEREALAAIAEPRAEEPVRPQLDEEPVLDGPPSDDGPPDIMPDDVSATSAATRSRVAIEQLVGDEARMDHTFMSQFFDMDHANGSDSMQQDEDAGRLLQLPAASDAPVSPSEARAQRRSQSRSQARTSPTSRAASVGAYANGRAATTSEQQLEDPVVSPTASRSVAEDDLATRAEAPLEPVDPAQQPDAIEAPEPPVRSARATRDTEMAPPDVPVRGQDDDASAAKPPPYAPPANEAVAQPSPPQQPPARQESITMSLERTTVSVVGSSFPDSYAAAMASAFGRALGNDDADDRRVEAPAVAPAAAPAPREPSREALRPPQAQSLLQKPPAAAQTKLRGRDSGVAGMFSVLEEAAVKESPVRRPGRALLQESDAEESRQELREEARETRSKKRASVTEEAPRREAAVEAPRRREAAVDVPRRQAVVVEVPRREAAAHAPIARPSQSPPDVLRERVEPAHKRQRVETVEERSTSKAPASVRTPLSEPRPSPRRSPAQRAAPSSHLRASTPHASKGIALRSSRREPSTQARSHPARALESRADTSSAEDAVSVRELADAARAKRKAALQHRQTNLETAEAEARVVQQRAADMRSAADRIMQAFTRDAGGQLARRLSTAEHDVHQLCSDFASGVAEISDLTAATGQTLLIGVDALEKTGDALEKYKTEFEKSSSALERMLRHTREGRAQHDEAADSFSASLFG